jgi:hypothetical protein
MSEAVIVRNLGWRPLGRYLHRTQPSEFESPGYGVESTSHNFWKQLEKRVADSKHGFESL